MKNIIEIYGIDGNKIATCGTPLLCSARIGQGVKLTLNFIVGTITVFAHLRIVEPDSTPVNDPEQICRPIAKVLGANEKRETALLRKFSKLLGSQSVDHTWAIVSW